MARLLARSLSHSLARVSVAVAIGVTAALFAQAASAAPYCLLRKAFNPPQGNCFQFYLADSAVAPPQTMAVPGAAGCEVTDYAARQGWEVDATLPGPHATSGEGDAAMSVVSPYFGDAYGCRAPQADAAATSTNTGGASAGGTGCAEVQAAAQPEQRDAAGTITVEASIIHVLACPDGRQVYLYEYLNRSGFRVINPPAWGDAVGGRDFGSMDEALVVAATGVAPEAIAAGGGDAGTGVDQPAQGNEANLSWMWQFKVYTFNGTITGTTKTGWSFNGQAVHGVVGSATCQGSPAEVEGIESGGGGRMDCTAQFPATASGGAASWTGTGQGRIDWDGMFIKAGGQGVRNDDSGRTEDNIGVLYLRPGLAPVN